MPSSSPAVDASLDTSAKSDASPSDANTDDANAIDASATDARADARADARDSAADASALPACVAGPDAGVVVASGFDIETLASGAPLVDPVGLTFGLDGKLYVANSHSWKTVGATQGEILRFEADASFSTYNADTRLIGPGWIAFADGGPDGGPGIGYMGTEDSDESLTRTTDQLLVQNGTTVTDGPNAAEVGRVGFGPGGAFGSDLFFSGRENPNPATGAAAHMHHAHNQLVALDRVNFTGEHLVFYEENQSVVVWGIARAALDRDDPPVEQGQFDAERKAWKFYPEFATVSEFAAAQCAWQAVQGGLPYVGVKEPGDKAAAAVARDSLSSSLGIPSLETAAMRAWLVDGGVALDALGELIGLATREAAQFSAASTRMGIPIAAWDYATLRDE